MEACVGGCRNEGEVGKQDVLERLRTYWSDERMKQKDVKERLSPDCGQARSTEHALNPFQKMRGGSCAVLPAVSHPLFSFVVCDKVFSCGGLLLYIYFCVSALSLYGWLVSLQTCDPLLPGVLSLFSVGDAVCPLLCHAGTKDATHNVHRYIHIYIYMRIT
ncbi:uncharacterized protein TEOVI_000534400 [Trypanosoma equiperdum]|uniref:T. brucei spp.-specific protein n=2 Tax=Trypanozoon TaxID=39700 RepID=Q383J6_TRYB2|nr:hypothetical protein Tb11.01.2600 [Trypanosoma brucei brucei TREU927]EAN80035.1 hypothetical protein Tb11.01.2600 [Trypanosoma brucei brucei TREU927]SCU68565.1 hypothetical protein, conserved [Trypanosoma equiperdum]